MASLTTKAPRQLHVTRYYPGILVARIPTPSGQRHLHLSPGAGLFGGPPGGGEAPDGVALRRSFASLKMRCTQPTVGRDALSSTSLRPFQLSPGRGSAYLCCRLSHGPALSRGRLSALGTRCFGPTGRRRRRGARLCCATSFLCLLEKCDALSRQLGAMLSQALPCVLSN